MCPQYTDTPRSVPLKNSANLAKLAYVNAGAYVYFEHISS